MTKKFFYDSFIENNKTLMLVGNNMNINNITIRNFTVFESIKIDFCNGINVFIGNNGTGKTHILKLILSACCYKDRHSINRTFGRFFEDIFNGNRNNIKHLRNLRKNLHSEFYIKFENDDDEFENTDGSFSVPSSFVNTDGIYIQSKDMLTHAYNFDNIVEVNRHVPFDCTISDLIFRCKQTDLKELPKWKQSLIEKLENIMGGSVILHEDEFFIQKKDRRLVNFTLEAEGIKRLALLTILLKNNFDTNSILIWDEPEANINPENIPLIVDVLLELQRNGIQIFISTHNYILAKYFEVKKIDTDAVMYHSLYGTDHGVQCESNLRFGELKNNSISETFSKLLDEIYKLD